ncbi:MAG: hypothetical protein PHO44_02590 [Sphaerochaetaceae bacterium]|jgi:hypothetical protein|nr:hypothetical protein [Sphaerochaetaceae bacterium]MDD3163282.1 hypothetical protein [Sphaerochaetaceae bacterium]MDD4006846.1 hypothetical protein [Sphaerochaetaceae bacterium]MDD4395976.1 hypothetical protein [Sphaerochaetaceae bacterium]
MKKVIIVLLIAAIGCSGLFAQGFLGTNVNYMGIGFTGGAESSHFGVESSVTLPVFFYASSVVEYFQLKGTEKATSFPNPVELVSFPFVSVNGYWKIVDGGFFGLNLGLKADALLSFDKYSSILVTYGPSLSADFKFSDNFALTLTGELPASVILDAIDDNLSQYGFFYATTDKSENANLGVMGILISIPTAIANISLKWTI